MSARAAARAAPPAAAPMAPMAAAPLAPGPLAPTLLATALLVTALTGAAGCTAPAAAPAPAASRPGPVGTVPPGSQATVPSASQATVPSASQATVPPGSAPGSVPPARGLPCDPLRTGPLPAWTADAGPALGDLPFVESREHNLVGVVFAQPLRAGVRADGRANKILWIARHPRDGRPLSITATRPGGVPVTMSEDADAGPGEIYPSIVDLPSAGCWTLTLTWNGNRATLGLAYGR